MRSTLKFYFSFSSYTRPEAAKLQTRDNLSRRCCRCIACDNLNYNLQWSRLFEDNMYGLVSVVTYNYESEGEQD